VPIAAIRPDDVNLPLLLHVLGAMALVGTLFAAVTLLVASRAAGGETAKMLTRLAFRTLLMGVLPSYIVMRVAAQWVASEENIPEDANFTWLTIGYIAGDLGALLTIIALIVGGIAFRRAGREGEPPRKLAMAMGILASVVLLGSLVAIWAMAAKPT
jgi:hypothetical protein